MEYEYHVKDRIYVQHKLVKLLCASMKFHALLFFVPHTKPNGVLVNIDIVSK